MHVLSLMPARPALMPVAQVFLSALAGYLAWSSPGPDWFCAIALIVPLLWAAAESRWLAGLVLAAYTAAANHGLIAGMMTFAQLSGLASALLWAGIAMVSFLVGAVCWHADPRGRALRVPLMLIVWSLPPFGLIGWHPLAAAGLLFPGWAWAGLIAGLLVPALLAWHRPRLSAIVSAPVLLLVAAFQHEQPAAMPGWAGHDTRHPWGWPSEPISHERVRSNYQNLVQSALSGGERVHLLPEGIGESPDHWAWKTWQTVMAGEAPQRSALVGAHVLETNTLHNALVRFSNRGTETVYRQRVPIPLFMWRPWDDTGHAPYQNTAATVDIDGTRAAVFLCYEGLLIWPFVESLLEQPDVILFSASMWWADDSLVRAQLQSVKAWARLFNLPLVAAINR